MSCAGYFERLLCKAQIEEEIAKNQALHDIEKKKEDLRLGLQNLRIEGKMHLANKVEDRLAKLEKITARMMELLEA